jgi:hypothetical protein
VTHVILKTIYLVGTIPILQMKKLRHGTLHKLHNYQVEWALNQAVWLLKKTWYTLKE